MKLVKFVVMYEVRLWIALYRWLFRRPAPVPPGSESFQYSGAVMTILVAFIVVSALEIPILHLMLPWELVRVLSLAVGFYGLFWMFGLLATMRVYPHLVGPDGLRIRNSLTLDLPIPWEDVREIRSRGRSLPPGGKTQFEGGVLSFGLASGTTVDVVLARPLVLPVKQTLGEPVTEIRFHADTPDALVAAARAHMRTEVG
ncbi:PH domain-containing protein [Actinoplanes sp. CA-142083]|uniref:PH domain-containing protein n=1 Tax=Actinoplanes sp. CA-142083 TaxID=3239903 RepID=UPI003D8C9C03